MVGEISSQSPLICVFGYAPVPGCYTKKVAVQGEKLSYIFLNLSTKKRPTTTLLKPFPQDFSNSHDTKIRRYTAEK